MENHVYNSDDLIIDREVFYSNFNQQGIPDDSQGEILRDILRYHLTDPKRSFLLKYYFEKLFFETEKFKQIKEELIENIDNNTRYHILHAYGKNGKSTFIRYFERESDFNIVLFDFAEINTDEDSSKPEFKDKCLNFIKELFDEYQEKALEGIINVLDHLISHRIGTNRNEYGDFTNRRKYNDLFSSFRSHLLADINEYKNKDQVRSYENDKEFIYDLFSNNVKYSSIINQNLFTLLVLVHINILANEKRKRIVFVLDNLDDVISDSVKYVNDHLSTHLDFFLGIITTYINEDKNLKFTNYPIYNQVHFIYSYRSANYVNAAFAANTSELDRTDFTACKSYLITTVKDSISILDRKCKFYLQNCHKYNIKMAPLYFLLRDILDSFKLQPNEEDDDFDYLMRVWNGNRYAFIDCVLAIKDYKYEKDFTSLVYSKNNVPKYIKRGVFFNHVIRYFHHVIKGSSSKALTEAIDYSLMYHNNSESNLRCNLFRLFMTYVSNNSRSQKNKIIKTRDVLDKGASFLGFMKEITMIKDSNNENLYSVQDIKGLFGKVFYEEIDSWGYLITCVMDNTSTSKLNDIKETTLSKHYNFEGLIDTFFENDRNSFEYKRLGQVRIYANDNGYFLSSKLKRHFEFFNITNPESEFKNKPLPFLMIASRRNKDLRCKLNPKYSIKYYFEFEGCLEQTTNRIINCTRKTVNSFTKNSFADSPKSFCEKSPFSYKETFYFADILSKSITYLEKIRQAVNASYLKLEFKENDRRSEIDTLAENSKQKILTDFNALILSSINNLISSFFDSLVIINNAYPDLSSETLKASENSFKVLHKKVNQIVNTNYNLSKIIKIEIREKN